MNEETLVRRRQGKRLWIASCEGEFNVVRTLVAERPSIVNFRGGYSRNTPLHVASSNGHTTVMQLLLSHGADIEARDEMGLTPLMYAFGATQNEAVDLLLRHQANIEARDNQG